MAPRSAARARIEMDETARVMKLGGKEGEIKFEMIAMRAEGGGSYTATLLIGRARLDRGSCHRTVIRPPALQDLT